MNLHFLSVRNFEGSCGCSCSFRLDSRRVACAVERSDGSDDGLAGRRISPRFAFDARDSLGSAQSARATTAPDALRLRVDGAPPPQRLLLPFALASLLPLSPSFTAPPAVPAHSAGCCGYARVAARRRASK